MKDISCPPVSRLVRELSVSEETAKALRERIKRGYCRADYDLPRDSHWSHAASLFMAELSRIGEFHGAESFYPAAPGIYYLNAGETYAATLIFRHDSASIRVGCMGDVYEKLPRSRQEY